MNIMNYQKNIEQRIIRQWDRQDLKIFQIHIC